MPRPIVELHVAHLRQPEAAPLAACRQARTASTGKLVGQRLLLPLRVAENDRAKLAAVAPVHAKDLLPTGHRLTEQLINRAGHGVSRYLGGAIGSRRGDPSRAWAVRRR